MDTTAEDSYTFSNSIVTRNTNGLIFNVKPTLPKGDLVRDEDEDNAMSHKINFVSGIIRKMTNSEETKVQTIYLNASKVKPFLEFPVTPSMVRNACNMILLTSRSTLAMQNIESIGPIDDVKIWSHNMWPYEYLNSVYLASDARLMIGAGMNISHNGDLCKWSNDELVDIMAKVHIFYYMWVALRIMQQLHMMGNMSKLSAFIILGLNACPTLLYLCIVYIDKDLGMSLLLDGMQTGDILFPLYAATLLKIIVSVPEHYDEQKVLPLILCTKTPLHYLKLAYLLKYNALEDGILAGALTYYAAALGTSMNDIIQHRRKYLSDTIPIVVELLQHLPDCTDAVRLCVAMRLAYHPSGPNNQETTKALYSLEDRIAPGAGKHPEDPGNLTRVCFETLQSTADCGSAIHTGRWHQFYFGVRASLILPVNVTLSARLLKYVQANRRDALMASQTYSDIAHRLMNLKAFNSPWYEI